MKTLSVAILFCLLAAAASQSHDLILGQATYGDVIVFKADEVKYGFSFIGRTSIIEYPDRGRRTTPIKAIYVKDNERDGSGGYPSISAGGIGQRFVKIKLKSQRGSGLNFTITIYGRYI
uniref:REPAT29 n=1 Tax=Spodoptera exigua TaxID=7107 RepID=I0B5U9_SPOEX|nr:REPAT29 [Spodoptera exigua]